MGSRKSYFILLLFLCYVRTAVFTRLPPQYLPPDYEYQHAVAEQNNQFLINDHAYGNNGERTNYAKPADPYLAAHPIRNYPTKREVEVIPRSKPIYWNPQLRKLNTNDMFQQAEPTSIQDASGESFIGNHGVFGTYPQFERNEPEKRLQTHTAGIVHKRRNYETAPVQHVVDHAVPVLSSSNYKPINPNLFRSAAPVQNYDTPDLQEEHLHQSYPVSKLPIQNYHPRAISRDTFHKNYQQSIVPVQHYRTPTVQQNYEEIEVSQENYRPSVVQRKNSPKNYQAPDYQIPENLMEHVSHQTYPATPVKPVLSPGSIPLPQYPVPIDPQRTNCKFIILYSNGTVVYTNSTKDIPPKTQIPDMSAPTPGHPTSHVRPVLPTISPTIIPTVTPITKPKLPPITKPKLTPIVKPKLTPIIIPTLTPIVLPRPTTINTPLVRPTGNPTMTPAPAKPPKPLIPIRVPFLGFTHKPKHPIPFPTKINFTLIFPNNTHVKPNITHIPPNNTHVMPNITHTFPNISNWFPKPKPSPGTLPFPVMPPLPFPWLPPFLIGSLPNGTKPINSTNPIPNPLNSTNPTNTSNPQPGPSHNATNPIPNPKNTTNPPPGPSPNSTNPTPNPTNSTNPPPGPSPNSTNPMHNPTNTTKPPTGPSPNSTNPTPNPTNTTKPPTEPSPNTTNPTPNPRNTTNPPPGPSPNTTNPTPNPTNTTNPPPGPSPNTTNPTPNPTNTTNPGPGPSPNTTNPIPNPINGTNPNNGNRKKKYVHTSTELHKILHFPNETMHADVTYIEQDEGKEPLITEESFTDDDYTDSEELAVEGTEITSTSNESKVNGRKTKTKTTTTREIEHFSNGTILENYEIEEVNEIERT